jgi:hypothetical protein
MRTTRQVRFQQLAACALLAASLLAACLSLPAQTPSAADDAHRGRWTVGAQLGYTMEYGLDWHEVSHIQLLIAQPQLGFILRDFQRSPVRRVEILDEGILGSAVHPHAAYLAGDAVLFRLDAKRHGRWVPFLDAGAGALRTPLARHVTEVNGFTQFTLQGGFGVQCFVRPGRALVFEWRTVHMSNADRVPPNMGFNSTLLSLGFRWRPRR